MNFRILATSAWPRGRFFALVAVTALTSLLIASQTQAQQPAPAAPATPAAPKAKKAAPKAAPAPAGAPAPAPTAQQAPPPAAAGAPAPAGQPADQIQLIYAPWTKFCVKGQDANAKQVCFTGKDGRVESGQPVIAAVIIEPEGEPKKILRVTLPLGMLLVHGTRLVVDSTAPVERPYVICLTNGCMSDYEVTPELLASIKAGQTMYVQAITANSGAVTLPLPLGAEFTKAYEGPPTDPKVFEENQKKLQEELQKRAEAARKKLEANSPPATAPAAPAK